MKSQEQRIKDAADALYAKGYFTPSDVEDTARQVLEAADREPPKWPTEQSVSEVYGAANIGTRQVNVDAMRRGLRAAMLADPIIKAAIAYRNSCLPQDRRGSHARAVTDAVNEAGLPRDDPFALEDDCDADD